jgi:hypothetical protein
MYYNRIKIKMDGSVVDDFDDYEIIHNDEKSGEYVIGDGVESKRPTEIFICPICQNKCEGAQELMEHYWGYCQKTRTYFDLHVDNWGCKNTN